MSGLQNMRQLARWHAEDSQIGLGEDFVRLYVGLKRTRPGGRVLESLLRKFTTYIRCTTSMKKTVFLVQKGH